MIASEERDLLRDLATQYKELCDSDRNQQLIAQWRNLNNLKPDRPMVHCNMNLLGDEIAAHFPDLPIKQWPYRNAAGFFRRMLWEATIGDDRVFYPWYNTAASRFTPEQGVWGIEPHRIYDESSRGWRHMPVIKTVDDLKKLKATEHRVLKSRPKAADLLEDVFGDIIPININRGTVYPIWGGTDLSEAPGALLGLEEMLFALYTNPDLVHGLMAFMRDAVMTNLKQVEAAGDWSATSHQNYVTPSYCDQLPDPTPNACGVKMKELCFFTHAQEFEGVSPEQHKEFLLDYQMPIMELFGKVNYGCCETLDTKLDLINTIPNLSKILAGPRADPAAYPDTMGERCVISWRPVATIVASRQFDEDQQRKQLREGLSKLKGCAVEVHMHEPMTVHGDLSRITAWCRIAREEAEAVA